MVEMHSIYNINKIDFNVAKLQVKHAGNPKPTLKWQDESGKDISSTYGLIIENFLTEFSLYKFNIDKPETITLIARNEKNITAKKEFHIKFEGICLTEFSFIHKSKKNTFST